MRFASVLALVSLLYSSLALSSDYYFGAENLDPSVTSPEQYLGYPVGEWHIRHDQLLGYFKSLAASDARVQYTSIGRTHEQRELAQFVISSAQNLARLEQIKQADTKDRPLIIWLGYSIHGDEPSGANASTLLAYYLLASKEKKVADWLEKAVIIIDPSFNPDGLDRFATWANMHKGKNPAADPMHREHNQDWFRGRYNHYGFDLNRDWLLLTQPESKARVAQFHQWKPNVLGDFHEMGTNSTYFFQPGIPSRKNPITPDQNVELTKALAQFHAEALDLQGSLYFTEESFDDFYYGKGSTYPDANGAVGILFEQASSRGHLQDSINGEVSFPFTIKNQLTTSLSTIEGAVANAQQLINYQKWFDDSALKLADGEDFNGIMVRASKEHGDRLAAMVDLLQAHQIKVYRPANDYKHQGVLYPRATSAYIPYSQRQYRLIKALFSTRQSFPDNTFYDVSAWTLPLAFDLDFVEVDARRKDKLESVLWQPEEEVQPELSGAYAYAIDWAHDNAPALAYQLLKSGHKIRVATQAFKAITSEGEHLFAAGTVVLPTGLEANKEILPKLKVLTDKYQVPVANINSGLTSEGIDLGSRSMMPVTLPKVAVLAGRSSSIMEVGEIWHYLDQFVDLPVTLLDQNQFRRSSLDNYTHIIIADGRYDWSESEAKKVKAWVKAGGSLIGQKRGMGLMIKHKLLNAELLSKSELNHGFDAKGLSYAEQTQLAGRKRIAGAIFQTRLDLSHPLGFGFSDANLPVFKNHRQVLLSPVEPFVSFGDYSSQPLMAGYTDEENQKLIKNTSAFLAHNLGSGKVIGFNDNLGFRGYFRGSRRLLSNAIFFSSAFSVARKL